MRTHACSASKVSVPQDRERETRSLLGAAETLTSWEMASGYTASLSSLLLLLRFHYSNSTTMWRLSLAEGGRSVLIGSLAFSTVSTLDLFSDIKCVEWDGGPG